MRTPDEILKDVGIDVETLKRENRELYDSIRKAMDEFADQYAEWREQKKLKPCPFCGGESIAYGHREENTSSQHGFDVPCSLHFVVVNIAAFQATGQTDKRVVTIKLTAEQQNELRQKVNRVDNASFFDVMMSFD